MLRAITGFLATIPVVVACSGSVAPDTGGAGTSVGCTRDTDCSGGLICAFKIADACAAKGVCVQASGGARCGALTSACACDGTNVTVGCTSYPSGYAIKPIQHTGPCGGAPDGGARACAKDGDCGDGQLCAFPINGGCSAIGQCFTPPTPQQTCNAYSPACACNGQTINVACTLYPGGTASAPILHSGACSQSIDAGAAFPCGGFTCKSVTEVCKITEGGPPPGTAVYTCVEVPSQCANNRTCDCVRAALGATLCSEDAAHDLTVTLEVP